MENPIKKIFKKMWYRQMLKSRELPQSITEDFFVKDRIDPLKFYENYAYYISLRGRFAKYEPTPSCFRNSYDLPLAFPRWFAAAYPDIVKYISALEETKFTKLFKDIGVKPEELEDYENLKVWEIGEQQLHHFSSEVLYMLKEHFKVLYPNTSLECQ